jgi:hypothetical protein
MFLRTRGIGYMAGVETLLPIEMQPIYFCNQVMGVFIRLRNVMTKHNS